MDAPELDIDHLKQLETPRDIMEAVLQLSRETGGKVMVRLAAPDKPETAIWLHPLRAQEEADNPRSHGNVRYKLQTEIEEEGLRITDIAPLDVDEKNPSDWLPPDWLDAVERFGAARGYKKDPLGYAGRMIRGKALNP